MAYVYLVLSSQVKARSTIAGNLTLAVDAQKVFKDMFNEGEICLLMPKNINGC